MNRLANSLRVAQCILLLEIPIAYTYYSAGLITAKYYGIAMYLCWLTFLFVQLAKYKILKRGSNE